MSLDEAIERNRERAEKVNEKANEQKGLNYGCYLLYKEHAEEYEQLADWLQQLKEYRELNIVHCKDCKHWGMGVPGETEYAKCCECGGYMVGAKGYCVYGEKECVE